MMDPNFQWIMTDDERNQLTTLARDIALKNRLSLSVNMSFEYFSLNFTRLDDETDDENKVDPYIGMPQSDRS